MQQSELNEEEQRSEKRKAQKSETDGSGTVFAAASALTLLTTPLLFDIDFLPMNNSCGHPFFSLRTHPKKVPQFDRAFCFWVVYILRVKTVVCDPYAFLTLATAGK